MYTYIHMFICIYIYIHTHIMCYIMLQLVCWIQPLEHSPWKIHNKCMYTSEVNILGNLVKHSPWKYDIYIYIYIYICIYREREIHTATCIIIVAIFYPFSQFCEIDSSLLSLQTQPNTAPNLFQRGVEYGKYVYIDTCICIVRMCVYICIYIYICVYGKYVLCKVQKTAQADDLFDRMLEYDPERPQKEHTIGTENKTY